MIFEFSNWYNDPFNDNSSKRKTEKKNLQIYNDRGRLTCRYAHDGRKQKACYYYYRNAKTKKCLFLEANFKCSAKEV